MLLTTLLFNLQARASGPDREVIHVRDQAAFDTLGTDIMRAYGDGKLRVDVKFSGGTYYFSEGHITLDGLDREDFRLSFKCHGATFIPKGRTYEMAYGSAPYEGEFSETSVFIDPDSATPVEFRTAPRQSLSDVSEAGDLFKLKASEPELPELLSKDVYIVLSQWYGSGVHKVEKIENGYIYFSSTASLDYLTRDRYYGKKYPKYILVNVPSPGAPCVHAGRIFYSGRRIHQGEATSFLRVRNCHIGSLALSKAVFIGNAGEGPLLEFRGTSANSIEVKESAFSGLHGRVVYCLGTSNFVFEDNTVTGCYLDGVLSDGKSDGTRIIDNTFEGNGLRMTQSFDVIVRGTDFIVSGNRFSDFSYAAIGIGHHFRSDGGEVTSGVVEDNEIFLSEPFLGAPVTRTLMDSGGIYIWTMNRDVTIRRNFIHDIDGAKDNRGIFGDDGASNVTAYGNLVLGIRNCYTLDFRRVANVETMPDSRIKRVNVGNRIYGNTVDGRIRFETRGGDDGCYKGDNIRVSSKESRRSIYRRWKRGKSQASAQTDGSED